MGYQGIIMLPYKVQISLVVPYLGGARDNEENLDLLIEILN